MTSTFGWVDTDAAQRRRMMEVLDAFSEKGMLDEFGIGQIRDAFADALYPGTSTLHTRVRYVFFVPWLMDRAVTAAARQQRDTTVTDSVLNEKLAHATGDLIGALRRGTPEGTTGIIGATAGRRLKQTPTMMYWSAVRTWRTANTPQRSAVMTMRAALAARTAPSHRTEPDDHGARTRPHIGVALLPEPLDFTHAATFDLRPEEASLLHDHITAAPATARSHLAWLLQHPDVSIDATSTAGGSAAFGPWDAVTPVLPDHLARLLDHARRFSAVVHAANLRYRHLLRTLIGADPDQLADDARALDHWLETEARPAAQDWDEEAFWRLAFELNPRISPPAREFVTQWVDLVRRGQATGDDAARLLTAREQRLKGPRARLSNPAARIGWGGARPTPLTYRWAEASSLVRDVRAGLPQAGQLTANVQAPA